MLEDNNELTIENLRLKIKDFGLQIVGATSQSR